MTDDLVAWLRVQFDADERRAKAVEPWPNRRWEYEAGEYGPQVKTTHGTWALECNVQVWRCDDEQDGCPEQAREWAAEGRWIAEHDPARVLLDVEAKRRILDSFARFVGHARAQREHETTILKALALPYADREGYRDEWRP